MARNMAVVDCIRLICSAFHDAAELLKQVKTSRGLREDRRHDGGLLEEMQIQDLELSLKRGVSVVQSQYDRDYKRFGAAFANGDHIALSALKDIIIHLQGQVILNLKITQQDVDIDFSVLQDASDESQDKTVLVLMQLQQRCITSDHCENLKPAPLFAVADQQADAPGARGQRTVLSPRSPSQYAHRVNLYSQYQQPDRVTDISNSPRSSDSSWSSPPAYQGPTSPTRTSMAPTVIEKIISSRAVSTQSMLPAPSFAEPGSPGQCSAAQSPPQHAPPHLASVALPPDVTNSSLPVTSEQPPEIQIATAPQTPKSRFSLFGRKIKHDSHQDLTVWSPPPIPQRHRPSIPQRHRPSIPAPDPMEHPALRQTTATEDSRSSQYSRPSEGQAMARSRFSSFSTTASGSVHPEDIDSMGYNPWSYSQQSHNQNSALPPTTTRSTSVSINRAPANSIMPSMTSQTISPRELLPSEANSFAGFCKGAWRLQIGDKKKAMEERQRPGGMFNANRYWQCSKCKFEGRLVQVDKKRKGFDTRVLVAEGLQFRWEFLFKSHVEMREASSDFLAATFGCVFCTAEGMGTPTFGGASSLMAHLQEHRDRLPQGEVLYRMNCLAGPKAGLQDDFDLNIVGNSEI